MYIFDMQKLTHMRVIVYLMVFFMGMLLHAACGVSSKTGADFTKNSNRSEVNEASDLKSDLEDPGVRSTIVKDARSLVGKKYRYGSCGPDAFDCSGFTQYVYKNNGITLPRSSGDQARVGQKVRTGQIREGDLVVFSRASKVSHVGICVSTNENELWVVHATNSRGVIMEDVFDSSYWKGRVQQGRLVIR